MPISSVITYDGLPVSSGGGHTLKTKDPLLALRQVIDFIETLTIATAPMECSVELVSGTGIPDSFFKPMHQRFSAKYGTERLQGLGDNTGHSWMIPVRDIENLAQLFASLRPLPSHPFGLQPGCVRIGQKFRFKAFDGSAELSGQGADNYMQFIPCFGQILGESEIYARLSEKSTMSMFLNFPFEEASPDFLRFRAFVQDHLPFKLSEHHWKRWTLTKRGDKYLGRKLGRRPNQSGQPIAFGGN